MILAPLRGVTISAFRKVFARQIREAGILEAITPFIPAMPGIDPLKDRELSVRPMNGMVDGLRLTPQFIGKSPEALKICLEKTKSAGFDTADLNCGCPFPMVRNKGRGSGILKTPDVLRKMLEIGCEVMGDGKFSIKARLGVDKSDELLSLMPMINTFPIRFLTIHGRIARQMYDGVCDQDAVAKIIDAAQVPIVINGDLPLDYHGSYEGMIGRPFVRALGEREDIAELMRDYIEISQKELFGDRPVLGRMKELVAYWKDIPQWHRRWNAIKLCRSVDELLTLF